MVYEVDRAVNIIENTLTDISAYPVVGTIAGGTKILMGAVQGLTAFAVGILTFIPSAILTETWLPMSLKFSWKHIKHGLGNMIAGAIEALPIVQTVLYGIRQGRKCGPSDVQVHIYTGHESKFMPYTSLIEQDWRIGGADDALVKRVKEIFNQKLQRKGVLFPKEQMDLAQEAILEAQKFKSQLIL